MTSFSNGLNSFVNVINWINMIILLIGGVINMAWAVFSLIFLWIIPLIAIWLLIGGVFLLVIGFWYLFRIFPVIQQAAKRNVWDDVFRYKWEIFIIGVLVVIANWYYAWWPALLFVIWFILLIKEPKQAKGTAFWIS
jgi:hypothetical protein